MENVHIFNCILRAETKEWSSGRIWADGILSGFWVNHIVRQALCLKTFVDPEDLTSVMREAFRLGILLFLAEIRRCFGVYPVTMEIHLSKLKGLLECSAGICWGQFLPLKIWVVAMAMMEARTSEESNWFAGKMSGLMKELDLKTGEELEVLLEELFWYPQIHSKLLWSNIRALIN